MARGKHKFSSGKKNKFTRERKRRPEKKSIKLSRKRNIPYGKSSGFSQSEGTERPIVKAHNESETRLATKVDVVDDDSSSEEEMDGFKMLLSTFNRVKTKTSAVESDDSEEDLESVCEDSNATIGKSANDSLSGLENSDDESSENGSIFNEEDAAFFGDEQEKEDPDDSLDPFVCHFHYDLDEPLLKGISSQPVVAEKKDEEWPTLGPLVFLLPQEVSSSHTELKAKFSLEENKTYAKPANVPVRISSVDWSKLFIKPQIQNNISKANYNHLTKIEEGPEEALTTLQKELFSIINNYQDLYYPSRSLHNGEEVRFVYCLHAVNHILKTRTKIIHHNAKLNKKDEVPDEFRDQGLVRPKVLILVPFKESARRVVKMLIDILLPDEKANVVNKARFFEEFTGNEILMPRKNPRPEDYEAMFAGNTDDQFRIGITVTKKSLKLYADFYSADIIVASPLGLRVIIGAEGEAERDYDFLASIEVLVLDQMDVFFMQNWDHVLHVLDHLHLQPHQSHGTDFSRVRSWAVNGWTRFYRQTILLSSHMLPEFNAVFNKKCNNYAGKVRVAKNITSGSICQVIVQLPQVFQKLSVDAPSKVMDARFDFFVKKILPQYKDALMNHTMIYIPSYFDYVRVRNYFKREEISFVQLCEYSKDNKIARARDLFFHSEAHFMLYSERFHFFRRLRIKGIRHIVFYQPPSVPQFYSELCNLMQEANQSRRGGSESNMSVTVLYSKYDALQLAAVVGTDRASRMLSSERDVHMFVTGE
ncbi:U3 small nucleolar RNA-associated protein 25 homolog [Anabrus simplex]|uniref:U3 small nucleolar RNA-associated protein 25 homolog n=1 Tax=Anabrus simplex TaxID=316456 RepID=UPI0035A34D89